MQILRQLIEIILRKRQPQDLAYDLNAAVISAVGIIVLGFFVYSEIPQISKPFTYNAAITLLQGLGIYGLLAINNKANRFVQSITAFFGVSLILQIVTIAIAQIPILAVLSLVLTIWNLIIIVLILRSSFECSTLKSICLFIAYNIFVGMMMIIIFPEFLVEFQAALESMSAATIKPK